MATYSGEVTGRDRIGGFIPNVWAGDIRRLRNKNFVMGRFARVKQVTGQKGDTYTEPLIGRAGVFDRLPGQPVILQARTPGGYRITVDQSKESSFALDDVVKRQSQYSLREPYIKEASYAMKRDLDNGLLALRAAAPLNQQIFVTSTATAAGVPQQLNNAAILAAKTLLDIRDVPAEDRALIVYPTQYNALLEIDTFISADFVNGTPVTNGVLGSLYNMPVIATTNMAPNSLVGYRNGDGAPLEPTPGVLGSPYMPTQNAIVGNGLPLGQTGNEAAAPFISCMMVQKDWAMSLIQKDPTVTASFENLLQCDALVTTQMYGHKLYREDHFVVLHTAV